MKSEAISEVGSFCPHEACERYGVVGLGNIILYGKSKQGRQTLLL